MAYIELREKARKLRVQGKSIAEITKELQASKSTVSYWCRNIVLAPRQIQRLAQRRKDGGSIGRIRAAEKKRQARITATAVASQKGRQDVGRLDRRDLLILGMGLYWGEGYKNGNDECGLTNSDPAIIKTFI